MSCNFYELGISIKSQNQSTEVFYKKGVLRNFTKFTVKQLFQGLPAILLKGDSGTGAVM